MSPSSFSLYKIRVRHQANLKKNMIGLTQKVSWPKTNTCGHVYHIPSVLVCTEYLTSRGQRNNQTRRGFGLLCTRRIASLCLGELASEAQCTPCETQQGKFRSTTVCQLDGKFDSGHRKKYFLEDTNLVGIKKR